MSPSPVLVKRGLRASRPSAIYEVGGDVGAAFALFALVLPCVYNLLVFVICGKDAYNRNSRTECYCSAGAFLCYIAWLRQAGLTIVVWAYLLAFRDPAAREQLDGRGWTVDGGYLMRLVIPQRGPDGQMQAPPLPNFIDLYLQMLEHMLSQRSQ